MRRVAARLRAGLPARGAVLAPEVRDALYEAHRALYRFAGRFAAGKRVLDLGCGTGYGVPELRRAGAGEVVGVESDGRLLAYARRRFAAPGVAFVAASPASPPADLGRFGLAVAINRLALLADPDAAIRAAARHLEADGLFICSVPPAIDVATMDAQRAHPAHRACRYLWDWERALGAEFGALRLFAQRPPAGVALDLADPGPARVAAEDYDFEEIPLADSHRAGPLAAVFVAARPRAGGGAD